MTKFKITMSDINQEAGILQCSGWGSADRSELLELIVSDDSLVSDIHFSGYSVEEYVSYLLSAIESIEDNREYDECE